MAGTGYRIQRGSGTWGYKIRYVSPPPSGLVVLMRDRQLKPSSNATLRSLSKINPSIARRRFTTSNSSSKFFTWNVFVFFFLLSFSGWAHVDWHSAYLFLITFLCIALLRSSIKLHLSSLPSIVLIYARIQLRPSGSIVGRERPDVPSIPPPLPSPPLFVPSLSKSLS